MATIVAGEEEEKAVSTISPSVLLRQALVAKTFRFDRLGQELFDGVEDDGASLGLDFDHQLVMSGKLAHLIPKSGQQLERSLKFEDLIFLLLFAILPEKQKIRRFFRCARVSKY